MSEQADQQLGNYRLVRLLGQGGFADVYLGEHVHLHTQAAIKILQMRLAEEHAESFINEARTIAHLIHPNIVRVLDFGVQNGTPFLVMDYAPGGTVRQRMPNGKPLPAAALFPFIGQVASALQYAHNRKLIHRDVKPENMLVGVNGEVLLSDFGLALVTQSTRSRSTGTGGGDISGTATYMAPEQVQGQPRPASDQYALGVMVYEWLTGTRPFQGTFLEVATQQVLAPTPSLRAKLPTISPAIEGVVMRAMAKDYQQRYPGVQDFVVALAQVCAQEGLISAQTVQAVQAGMPATPASTSQGQSPLGNVSQLTYLPSATNQGSQPSPAATPPNQSSQLSFMKPPMSQGLQNNYAAETLADPQASQMTFVKQPGATQQTQWPPNNAPSSQANLTQMAPGMNAQMTQMAPQPLPSQAGMPPFGQQQAGAGQFGNQPFTPSPVGDNIGGEQRRTNKLLVLVSVLLVCVLVVAGATGIWYFTSARGNNQKGAANASTPGTTATASNAGTGTAVAPTATSAGSTGNAAPTPTTATGNAPTPGVTPTTAGNQVPNPYMASMGTQVFNDSLSSNQNNWDEGDPCTFTGGAYHVTVAAGQDGICYAKSTNYTNFTYEVQMAVIKGGPTGVAGIEFRGNNGSGASYRIELSGAGKYTFLACTEAKTCTPLKSGTAVQLTPGQASKLAVVASGNTFSFFLGGQQIFSGVQDGTSTQGMIGVYAQGGEGGDGVDAAFSNAKVWQ